MSGSIPRGVTAQLLDIAIRLEFENPALGMELRELVGRHTAMSPGEFMAETVRNLRDEVPA